MNLWDKLFTTQISEPPQFELHWYIGLLCLLALTFMLLIVFATKLLTSVLFRFFSLFN